MNTITLRDLPMGSHNAPRGADSDDITAINNLFSRNIVHRLYGVQHFRQCQPKWAEAMGVSDRIAHVQHQARIHHGSIYGRYIDFIDEVNGGYLSKDCHDYWYDMQKCLQWIFDPPANEYIPEYENKNYFMQMTSEYH